MFLVFVSFKIIVRQKKRFKLKKVFKVKKVGKFFLIIILGLLVLSLIPHQNIVFEEENDNPLGRVISIRYYDYGFDPIVVNADLGEIVTLNLSSVNGEKRFELPAFNIYEKMPVNDYVLVTFNASRSGSSSFSCGNDCKNPDGDFVLGYFMVD